MTVWLVNLQHTHWRKH